LLIAEEAEVQFKRRRVLQAGAAASGLVALNVPSASAQTKAEAGKLIPLNDFFRFPDVSNVRLAPDGKSLLGTRFVKGRRNILVVDLETRKARIITNYRDADVGGARWVNSQRIIFTLGNLERGSADQVRTGIFAINKDASGFREIVGINVTGSRLASGQFAGNVVEKGAFTEDIFVETGGLLSLGRVATNLHRVNTVSGIASIVTLGGPGRVVRWVLDKDNVPRAAVGQEDGGITIMYVRESSDAPWRTVARFGPDEPDKEVLPIEFDAAGTLYVASRAGGRDLQAIYRFDWKAGRPEPEPLFAIKDYDLGDDLIIDPLSREVLGFRFDAERAETFWVNKEIGAMQSAIDGALPNRVNSLSRVYGGREPILVTSYSDVEPTSFFLYSPGKKQIEQIAASRPWIQSSRMSSTTPIRYKARDGLSIPAMLTVPKGSTGKNLPLVVMHYGGPWVRAIDWRYDESVQFLASRGYAVLMPAPRASTGFGWRLYRAGWRQWGLSMQDDVTDGVRHLIGQGIVDPKRVCIAGASYGGYLTMMGLVKEPDLFRCGINWVGVTDPEFMLTVTWSDFNRVDVGRWTLPLLIGDPKKDAQQFANTSPLRRAAEIKQPVLMAYGGLDDRVPIIHGTRMRDALAGHNPNVEWVVYSDEGHGWLKEESNFDFWGRVEAFLAKNLAPVS
jgi:dipeptidyl aminopeptidase/acylaminoacyl peptidase